MVVAAVCASWARGIRKPGADVPLEGGFHFIFEGRFPLYRVWKTLQHDFLERHNISHASVGNRIVSQSHTFLEHKIARRNIREDTVRGIISGTPKTRVSIAT